MAQSVHGYLVVDEYFRPGSVYLSKHPGVLLKMNCILLRDMQFDKQCSDRVRTNTQTNKLQWSLNTIDVAGQMRFDAKTPFA